MLFATLEHEVATLDAHLLDNYITEFPDAPTLPETISMNAYLVLAHGCIEEFVEFLFQDFAKQLLCEDGAGTVSRAVAMAAFAWQGVAKSKSYNERSLEDILKSGPAVVDAAVDKNHGVKESNILSLAKAAGIEWPAFEDACQDAIASLETLGAKRGSVAHVSTARSQITLEAIYPREARQWVQDALGAVNALQLYLEGLLAQAQRPPSALGEVT